MDDERTNKQDLNQFLARLHRVIQFVLLGMVCRPGFQHGFGVINNGFGA